MSDIFISYAHSTAQQARAAAAQLRALGYSVWFDDDLPAHRSFTHEIEAQLTAAKAALVIWSADAAKSDWVLSEANRAREDHKLVQLTLDGERLPMPFDQIQCADLKGWTGDVTHEGWRKVLASIATLTGGAAAASPPDATPQTEPLTLPDKPSIAVLPFADPSGATEGDYFADGMVDEIVTALAKFPALFVAGSSSSLSYRQRERDVARIGRDLGVRYLLEGSVRRSGGRVRISVSLVEAADGEQLWADRFDGTLEDVFALQDEVANAVAARIEPTILTADLRRGAARPTSDQSAYDLFLRARQRLLEYDRASWPAARDLLEAAVARDPGYARAWSQLALGHSFSVAWGWSDDPQASLRDLQHAMRQALATGGDDPEISLEMAFVSLSAGGDPRACRAMADRALAQNPGSVQCWTMGAAVSLLAGDPAQGLERAGKALRLDPRATDRHSILSCLGSSLTLLGRCDEALPWLEEALTLRPNAPTAMFLLVQVYADLGRTAEARRLLARAETLLPARAWIERNRSFRGLEEAFVRRHRATLAALGADIPTGG